MIRYKASICDELMSILRTKKSTYEDFLVKIPSISDKLSSSNLSSLHSLSSSISVESIVNLRIVPSWMNGLDHTNIQIMYKFHYHLL